MSIVYLMAAGFTACGDVCMAMWSEELSDKCAAVVYV